ncbi:hypothetical protein AB6A40_008997 [Gnathostoma spinigerum]|uniref:Adaptive response protein AidB N-terminal domain-containing protein n=1 Tax=Gnathostoma spinigerum TaxID=75299 RepID=A0ABD6EYY2_9BILA
MPRLSNPWDSDPILARFLRHWMPEQEYKTVKEDLSRFGGRIVQEIDGLGREAERVLPELKQFDAWGNRIDHLIVSPAWIRLKGICAEEKLIGIYYVLRCFFTN